MEPKGLLMASKNLLKRYFFQECCWDLFWNSDWRRWPERPQWSTTSKPTLFRLDQICSADSLLWSGHMSGSMMTLSPPLRGNDVMCPHKYILYGSCDFIYWEKSPSPDNTNTLFTYPTLLYSPEPSLGETNVAAQCCSVWPVSLCGSSCVWPVIH